MSNDVIEKPDSSLNKNSLPICSDKDEDCAGLDYLNCYLYDPSKGVCPFLSSNDNGETP